MTSKKIRDSNARLGSLGIANILFKLRETPTKTNPANAAADAAVEENKLLHSFIDY